MDKPFLTIDKQIRLLNSRGVETDDVTSRILLCEGYYSIINGYKAPFIDTQKTAEEGDDRYLPGTKFLDIYALFLFDRKLREITFRYLIKIEVLVRTVCAYTFSERHNEPNAYLNRSNFTPEDSYILGKRKYQGDLDKLLQVLTSKIYGKYERHEFIEYYKAHHDNVPLWVVANALSFGNIEHLYDLMKPVEQNLVCKRIMEVLGKVGKDHEQLTRVQLRRYLNVLVKFRNVCAHDERLYCAEVGRRNKTIYVNAMLMMVYLLPMNEGLRFILETMNHIEEYSKTNKEIAHILESMRIEPLYEIYQKYQKTVSNEVK